MLEYICETTLAFGSGPGALVPAGLQRLLFESLKAADPSQLVWLGASVLRPIHRDYHIPRTHRFEPAEARLQPSSEYVRRYHGRGLPGLPAITAYCARHTFLRCTLCERGESRA
jgi:integrase